MRADSEELCRPPDVDTEILQAAWAYVHERYPMQPWPNDVYLVGDMPYMSYQVSISEAIRNGGR